MENFATSRGGKGGDRHYWRTQLAQPCGFRKRRRGRPKIISSFSDVVWLGARDGFGGKKKGLTIGGNAKSFRNDRPKSFQVNLPTVMAPPAALSVGLIPGRPEGCFKFQARTKVQPVISISRHTPPRMELCILRELL